MVMADEEDYSQLSAIKSKMHSRSLRGIVPLLALSNSISSTLRWTRLPLQAYWLTKLVNAS